MTIIDPSRRVSRGPRLRKPPRNSMNEDSARHAAAAGLSLEAENAQLRVENEQLLQQITRLALFVEEQTGRDPIPIMHGHSSTKAAPAAAAPAAATSAAAAPTPPPPPKPPPPQPAPPPPSGWGSWLRGALLGSDDDPGPPAQDVFEWVGDGDEDDDPGSAWSDGRLAAALLAARGVRECKLQGCGLATLPGAREVWEHLAPTTHTLALSGNALDDLPASVGAPLPFPGWAGGPLPFPAPASVGGPLPFPGLAGGPLPLPFPGSAGGPLPLPSPGRAGGPPTPSFPAPGAAGVG